MVEGYLSLTRSSKFRNVSFKVGQYLISVSRAYREYYGLVVSKGYSAVINTDECRRLLDDWDSVARLIRDVTASQYYTFAGPFKASEGSIIFNVYYDVFKDVEVTITRRYIALKSRDFNRKFRHRRGLQGDLIQVTLNIFAKYIPSASGKA